ncbi:hypothetical protein ACFSJQ_23045 [Vibrio olivae]
MVKQNVEVLTELQANAIRTFSELDFNTIKAAREGTSEVLNASQIDLLAKPADNMLSDGQRLQRIANQFRSDIQHMTQTQRKKSGVCLSSFHRYEVCFCYNGADWLRFFMLQTWVFLENLKIGDDSTKEICFSNGKSLT